uniref:RING-CH-type domain-containing protein n=1 Tax=Oryza punctata TaxID=4537 RepID=A0A0E0L5F6_ORYPU
MADHFAVMAGRLLTESTVQSAIDEASAAMPSSVIASYEDVEDGRPKSGVLVECRICQEEDDQTYMETPCSCRGSLKYAHRKCIQRWCDEKGDTICEICLQQYTPNYTAPSKLFQHGRNSIFFRTPGYVQAQVMQSADRSAAASTSYDPELPNPKGLMVLLLLHDAISVFLGDHVAYTVAMITLLMLRTAGIVIPVYIILVSVTELLHRRNQRQISDAAAAVDINQQAPQSPRQQHVINIQ